MKKLSCKEAKQVDMVDYLASLSHSPKNVKAKDYWYLSPFRQEKTPSFKINRSFNLWYDFGEGKGGDIIDFGKKFFRCSINEFLEKLTGYSKSKGLSFHPQNLATVINPPLLSVSPARAGEKKEASPGKIQVLAEKPLTSAQLFYYLQSRCIPQNIAEKFCKQVEFQLYDKNSIAIGFKNDKGGFELRNASFKGSSSPKTITLFENGKNELSVFEGFFDFLSFQVLLEKEPSVQTNWLVLNSLAFFRQSREIMDKYQSVHLFLDRNKHGILCTEEALGWDKTKYRDQSKLYREGQDLNDWLMEKCRQKSPGLLEKHVRINKGKSREI